MEKCASKVGTKTERRQREKKKAKVNKVPKSICKNEHLFPSGSQFFVILIRNPCSNETPKYVPVAFNLPGCVVRSSLSLLGFSHLLPLPVYSPTLVVLCRAFLWRRSETFPSQPDLHSDSERPDVSGCCRFRLVVEGDCGYRKRRLET